MLWIPEKSSPRREHLSSPESTATLAGGGVSGQWVQNPLRSKVTTSSHGTWNSGREDRPESSGLGMEEPQGVRPRRQGSMYHCPLSSPWTPGLLLLGWG